MPTVKCPKCGQQVPFGRFCCLCTTPLLPDTDEFKGLDAYGFWDRAQAMRRQMERIRLARIQALKVPGDGSLPYMRDIQVDDGARLFLYSSAQPRPVQLPPGTYSAQDLFRHHGVATSVQPYEDQSWCCFCWVQTRPPPAVVALPDPPLLGGSLTHEATDVEQLQHSITQAIRTLSLVDRDNQRGGAMLQIELRCTDAGKFMETVVQDFLEDHRQALERDELPTDQRIKVRRPLPPPEQRPRGFFATLARWAKALVGVKPPPERTGPPSELTNLSYTLMDLYKVIHMEFRSAIQEAIRQMSAQELFENRNNSRRQVESAIQNTMSVTLTHYGLAIDRVSAFEFICPEATRARDMEAKLREAQGQLELRKQAAEVNTQTAQVVHDELVGAEGRDATLQTVRLDNQAKVAAAQDLHAREALGRKHEAEGLQNAFARQQRGEEATLALKLEKDQKEQEIRLEHDRRSRDLELLQAKIRAAADAQMALERHELEQLNQFIAQIKDLPADKMQLLIAVRNPQLAALWSASQQHAAQQQIIELQRQQQQLLAAANSQSSREIADFMTQVAGIVGQIFGAERIAGPVRGAATPQVTSVSVVEPKPQPRPAPAGRPAPGEAAAAPPAPPPAPEGGQS
jgi:hypothetical protein